MRLHRTAALVAAVLSSQALLAGCTGGDDDDDAVALTGDMSGAVGVAMRKPAVEEGGSFTAGGATVDTSAQPFFSLVKIDGNGNIDPVFNAERPIAYVTVSETHVVVTGDFHDILDADGHSTQCYVVAFPRTASGEAVTCLSRGGPGTWPANDPNNSEFGFGVGRMPGVAIRGADVLFTETITDGSNVLESKLWRWASGAPENELLLLLNGEVNLNQPWTTPSSAYVCVDDAFEDGSLYCSPSSGAPDWADTGASLGAALILGTNIVAQDTRVSLADGSVGSYPGTFPVKTEDTVMVSSSSAVGIRDGLHHYTPTSSSTIDSTIDWERILGGRNYAYVYGSGQLRRVDLGALTLGTANLLGDVGIIQVTDMSLTTDDNLRLDGTTSTGLPGIVLLDTVTGEVTVTQDDVPRFESVTELQ